jgi:hypothetical protein
MDLGDRPRGERYDAQHATPGALLQALEVQAVVALDRLQVPDDKRADLALT